MPSRATNRRGATNDAPAPRGAPGRGPASEECGAAPKRGRGPPSMLMVRQDSLASVVSDMTMMTYSKEKADMIVEEFHRRARRSPGGVNGMTEEEKHALVMEIKAEQEEEFRRKKKQEEEFRRKKGREEEARQRAEENERFQRWLEEQETEELEEEPEDEEPEEEKKEREKIDGSGRGDLLTRFRALKRTEIVRQERERLAGRRGIEKTQSHPQVSMLEGEDKEKLSGFQEIKLGTKGKRPTFGEIRVGTVTTEELRDEPRKTGTGRLVQSFSSTETAKVENVARHWSSSFSSFFSNGSGAELGLVEDCEMEGRGSNQNRAASQPGGTGQRRGSHGSADIAQIVELKLLAAEQQAAIDTLSSTLHNVELANRQRRNADRARLIQLERENRRLASESRTRDALEARREDRLRDLEAENAALRRLLALPFGAGSKREMRPSGDTVSTASTDSGSVPHTL